MYIYIPCRFYSQNLKFEKTGNSRSGSSSSSSSSSRKETNKESERDTQTRIRRTTVIRVG